MNTDMALRKHLVDLLDGGHAHIPLLEAIDAIPAELRGKRVPAVPYTAWQILEHLRIAQWDILEFSRNASHVSPEWPAGYWPRSDGPQGDKEWDASVGAFTKDLEAMRALVSNPSTDLYARIPHGTGQTILREALLVADHNAYHIGQLVLLRRLIGAWTTP